MHLSPAAARTHSRRSHLRPSNLGLQRRFRDSDPGDLSIITETSRQHRQDACTYLTYGSTFPACREHAVLTFATVPQVVPHQAEAGQGPEAEQAHPPVDPPEDRQHHQVCPPRNTRLDWRRGLKVKAWLGGFKMDMKGLGRLRLESATAVQRHTGISKNNDTH